MDERAWNKIKARAHRWRSDVLTGSGALRVAPGGSCPVPEKLRHCQRVSGMERTTANNLRHLVINLDREVLGGGCGLGRAAVGWRGRGR